MRSKLQRYKTIAFVLGLIALLFILLFIAEKRTSIRLSQLIQKQDTIEAPYYEKDAFIPPKKTGKKNGEQHIKIPIIMYHYVEYVKDDSDLIRKRLNIEPSLFEGHLQALKKANYETYFVKDVPDIISGTTHYSTQSAVLTFDDGYEDFYSVVFPLLKQYHMRATVYVIYDYIGRNGFLNEKQIRELVESGLVEIGSHTLDHVYLKQSPKIYADKQIIESKNIFEERFGIKIQTFAYPYGAFNLENIAAVKEAGYTAAVSVISGQMQSNENIYFLSRIRPGLFTPSSMIEVIEKMNK